MKAKPTGINMGTLYPLHGTEVYDDAARDGTLVGDWGLLEDYPRVRLPWMRDIDDLAEHWRKVSRRFWLNPGTLARGVAANIKHFGPRDYLAVARAVYTRYLRR